MNLTGINMKQKSIALKGGIDKFMMTVEYSNNILSIIDRMRHKISNIEDLNNSNCYELNVIIEHSTLHQQKMLFSSALGTFTKIDHVCSHKTSHNEFAFIKNI